MNVKALYQRLSARLREDNLNDEEISIFLSVLKDFYTGVPFVDAELSTMEELGFVRHGNSKEYGQPEKKTLTPSKEFKRFLDEAPDVWSLTNEAAKRVVINMFLQEVVAQLLTVKRKGREFIQSNFGVIC